MSSWRDTASQQAQDDLDRLLDPALGFARRELADKGAFWPFAVVVDTSGDTRLVGMDLGEGQAVADEVRDALVASLRADRDAFRATAVVYDVSIEHLESDAVQVVLEHAEGVSLAVALPYRKGPLGGYEYADLRAARASRVIWV